MAGFHTHIAVSTAVGVGYAMWGGAQYDLPLSTCLLAGGLCSVAGIMPDLDSDSGIPARETISLAAALVPMLLFQRFQAHGMSVEHMVLAGAPIYLVIRFGLGSILKSVSVHRGMFHSIPAAIIAGLIGYLICDEGVSLVRYYKAFAVTLGYMTHLMLDEIWSLDFGAGVPRVKKSFGTALKLFGDDPGATLTTYCLLGLLTLFATNDKGTQSTPLPFAKRTPVRAPVVSRPPTAVRPTSRRVPYDANQPIQQFPDEVRRDAAQFDDSPRGVSRWDEEHRDANRPIAVPRSGSPRTRTAQQPELPDDDWQPPKAARRTRLDDDWR
ncbi:MAG: metal-dependent hydrolase [Planctomycetales bacterium]|nr:metal-dependent hydrolase [Planctomycetales bacterium]